MRMAMWKRAIFIGLVMAAVPGLAADLPRDLSAIIEDTAATGRFDVYHWWTAGGEKEAIETALAAFQARYPNITAVSNAIPGGAGGAMVMKVKVLVITGNSPESFQAHPGYEIEPYTESNMLFPVTGIWEYDRLEERLLPGIAEMCKIGDDYYLVPIGVHRTNVVWYNKHVFDQYGIQPPEEPVTWEEFWALCDQLQAILPAGQYPLDLGDRMGWPATHVFETIMMGLDPQLYEDFINGKATEAQIADVLRVYKKFLSYVPPDHTARLWYEAAGRVYAGDSAMYLHGCWIKAYFSSRGWVYGQDYGAFAAPGTTGTFGLCVDAFVVPRGSKSPEHGVRWAHMCTDRGLQEIFSPLKGSISPYRDTSTSLYDPLTLAFYNELLDPNTLVYPSFTHGIALPWSVLMDLHSRITDFTTSSDPDVTRHARMIYQAMREADIPERWDIVP